MSFLEPDLLEHGPVPFWFWNDRLSEPELRRQVRLMADKGVRSFIIHARWGLKTPYLSAQWWRQVKTALDEAKRCGSRVWLYDEYNYPSGIGGFKITRQARFRERFLSAASLKVEGGAKAQLKLPQGTPAAVYAYPLGPEGIDAGRALDLGPAVKRGRVRFQAPAGQAWLLSAFSWAVEPFKGSGRYSVNYLAPEPTRAFIQLTHEAYRRELGADLGSVAPVFFLDEPRFNNALPWDERLPLWFRRRRGYELAPKLALLLHQGEPGLTARVRRDYYSLLSDLFCENFFQPIQRWCTRHGMRLTGHLMAEETLAGSTRFSGDGFKPYASFDIPGCDHLGRGIGGLAPKLAASAGHLQGAERVSCEAFAGCGQDFTPAQMNSITDWLFSQGVNLVVPHAFFYARRTQRQKDDWPPSMFFQWAHWKDYGAYVRRVARLAQSLSGGRVVADIALYHPSAEFQGAYRADPAFKTGYFEKGPAIAGERALELERWFQRLGQGLGARQRDFHILPQRALDRLAGYRVLLLPPQAELGAAARRQVARFKAQGGRVLQGPAEALFRGLDAALRLPDIRLDGAAGLRGSLLELDGRIHDPYLHQGLDADLAKGRGGVAAMHYSRKGEESYFFVNLTAKPLRFRARLRCSLPRAELRWPGTGRCEDLPLRRQGGVSSVTLALPAQESALVVFLP